MTFVGILMQQQAFYIKGVEDSEKIKESAFGAMGMFIFSFFASCYGVYHHEKYRRSSDIQTDIDNFDRLLHLPEGTTAYLQ